MEKICIVLSTYKSEITNKLCDSAKNELEKSGFNQPDIVKIPGSFEIPVTISRLTKKYDGFIAIGCIIKGETTNFDLISSAITNEIMKISTSEKKPIGNAVLTCFNKDQAKDRFDRGGEAAKAVVAVLKNAPSE